VALQPGETKQVSFTITPDMLSFFDADAHQWVAEEGQFMMHIASSSADIYASLPYNYKK
jgi:beta-glucosidase